MKKSELILKSMVTAAGVFIYTSGVAWFLFNGEMFFGNKKSFLIPLFLLLLFIFSASVTGLLVLGKPILLYLGGHKKDAFTLLFATLAWLIFLALAVAGALLVQ